MSSPHQTFVKSLLKGPNAHHVVEFLERAERCPSTWRELDGSLKDAIELFERRQIASAYARVLGAPEAVVGRRQDFLLRTAVTAILFPMAGMEDRLLVHLDERGLPTLFHHAVRELSEQSTDVAAVFAVADACRMSVFTLEDAMRTIAEGSGGAPELLEAYVDALSRLHMLVKSATIPYGWAGVALLWVTANYGLGSLPDDPTATEHFAEWEGSEHGGGGEWE